MNCRQLTLAQLSRLVGQPTIHNGASCHVIEVLAEGPTLVLQDDGCNTEIQDNRFGEPNRSVPRTYIVPLLEGEELNPDFILLNLLDCN
ncbi:MAG: hypothetical protein WCX90_00190 [Thiohalomonadaceae bacterium]